MSEEAKKSKLVLIGYMGSGKTTIGKRLATRLNLPFYDLDEIIINETQKSIEEIFKSNGESGFRKIESMLLKDWLTKNEKGVLACGGGTPCYKNNMKLINTKAHSIWIKASIMSLTIRLGKSKDRPLIKDLKMASIKSFITVHLKERSPFYRQALIKVISNKNYSDIVDRIVSKL